MSMIKGEIFYNTKSQNMQKGKISHGKTRMSTDIKMQMSIKRCLAENLSLIKIFSQVVQIDLFVLTQ